MSVSSYRKPPSNPIDALNTNPLLKKMFENADIPTDGGQKDKVQTWDDLKQLQEVCGSGILEVATEINNAVRLIKTAEISNPEIILTVNGLSRDLMHFTDQLVSLKNRHEHRTGPQANPGEYAEIMNIGMDYMTYQEKFSGVMFQPLVTLTEFHNEAIQKLNEQKEADITNPAVISDIEVKEVSND